MASPNTSFVANQVLTAAQQNNLPFGKCGLQTLNTQFTTSATHTTFQDTGMTLTVTEVSGRLYRITAICNPFPSGGSQVILMQLLRGASVLKTISLTTGMLSTAVAIPVIIDFIYTSVGSGSSTFKIQMAGQTANTSVADFGSAAYPRQFVIEDIGSN